MEYDEELERSLFEDWYEEDAYPLESASFFLVDSEGDYISNTVWSSWDGWVAGVKSKNARFKITETIYD